MKKHRILISVIGVIVLLLLVTDSCLSADNAIVCLKKNGDFYFDGCLDDAVWANKLVAPFFLKSEAMGQAAYQTSVYMMWDDNYLYICARCRDDDIVAHYTKRDDPIYLEDVFEIFIRPDVTNNFIFEFEFSPTGVIWDGLDRRGLPNSSGYAEITKKAWNAKGAKCKTNIRGTLNNMWDRDVEWITEIMIPLACFAPVTGPVKPGERWQIVFARCESSAYLEKVEWSASIPLKQYGVWENYAEWPIVVFQ